MKQFSIFQCLVFAKILGDKFMGPVLQIFFTIIFKNGPSRPLVHFIVVFQSKQHIFNNKQRWKMSIQYMALGFEPKTFGTWVSSHNHYTRAPALSQIYLPLITVQLQTYQRPLRNADSVTRLGNLLNFRQLFKGFGNN